MMDFVQQNTTYVVMAVLGIWIVWKRIVAPKLSGVKSISSGDYLKFRKQPHVLLDVRSLNEWSSGHAPSALHLPLRELLQRKDEIDKDVPIVVLCASGNRSMVAATALAKEGFTPVYNFSGGMGAWKSTGLPIKMNH